MLNETLVAKGKEREFFEILEGSIKGNESAAETITGLLRAFMRAPEEENKAIFKAAKMRALAVTTDFGQLTTTTADVFQNVPEYDQAWMQAFREVPSTDRGYFEIATDTGAGSWAHVPEGGEIVVNKFTGSVVQVPYVKTGYGLGWTLEMIQDRQLGVMFDRAEAARSRYYVDLRTRAMSLLKTTALLNTSNFQAYDTTGSTVRDKDVNTINGGYVTLMGNILNSGYGNAMAQQQCLLFARYTMAARLNQAFRVMTANTSALPQVEYPVQPVYTWDTNFPSPAATSALLVLPGRKLQYSQRMAPTVYQKTDILSATFIESIFARNGWGAADHDQVLWLKFA